jgi:mono/diheme cytochrome c family protein
MSDMTMKFTRNIPKIAATGLLIGGLIATALNFPTAAGQSRVATITVPTFSKLAKEGKVAFDQTCAKCHGKNGVGTDKGPPLLHQIYNPGHHGDAAFYRAVKHGSQQHHWRFGNMPPQPNVTDKQIAAIIRYVRELQTANGIVLRQHRM